MPHILDPSSIIWSYGYSPPIILNWPQLQITLLILMELKIGLYNNETRQNGVCVLPKLILPSLYDLQSLILTSLTKQWSFLLLCKILCHYKSLKPSKSLPQKSNHDSKEKYHYMHVGSLEPMRIIEILPKNRFFCRTPAF